MLTAPIAEWAQIGGLAILWGEFQSDDAWKISVQKCSDMLIKNNGQMTDLAEKLIEYVQGRDSFLLGIGNRDMLETTWNQIVANTIRDRDICKTEYDMYERNLKTDSALLKAFCPRFMVNGFISDPAEVFWVLCINPYLSEDKKYHTRFSWEDKLNA